MGFLLSASVLQTFAVGGLLTATCGLTFEAYRRGRKALREREGQLQGTRKELAVLANALREHESVTTINSEGVFVEVNQRFLDSFGYRREDIIGHRQSNFYVGDSLAKADEMTVAAKEGQLWSDDIQMLRADGSVALTQCKAVPVMDESGQYEKTIILQTDVTEHRRAEAEKLMTLGFDKMPATVFVFDPKSFAICYMNRHSLVEQGWLGLDNQCRSLWEMDFLADRETIEAALEGLCSAACVSLPLSRAQESKSYEAQFFQVSANGGDIRILALVQDVTARVAAQRRQQDLVSVIAHELRTPLTSIKGAIKLLGSGAVGEMSEKAGGLIEIAENNSERMLLLIKDLLDLEKIEGRDFELDLAPVDTAHLIEDAMRSHRSYGLDLGVQFVRSGQDGAFFVMGDEGRLMQVLSNLMSNAAKFSSFGSQIELGIEERSDTEVGIFVKDYGTGIPEDARARLFDRFTQANNAGNVKIDGSGLGLSIVRSLVEKHGGTVDFETELGKGTTFRVCLPKALPPDANDRLRGNARAA